MSTLTKFQVFKNDLVVEDPSDKPLHERTAIRKTNLDGILMQTTHSIKTAQPIIAMFGGHRIFNAQLDAVEIMGIKGIARTIY